MVVASPMGLTSVDMEEKSREEIDCTLALREGKQMLKEKQGSFARTRFERALMLAQQTGNKVQERRAVRGLSAAARLQGQHREAIRYLEQVLQISQEIDDHVGDADAYGTIADMYTDLGLLEDARAYYMKYMDTMVKDGPV
eukprot:jgi/Botrbrau1/15943/Bobra.0260s0004.2